MATKTVDTKARLKALYNTDYAPALMKELGLKNFNDVPRLLKSSSKRWPWPRKGR